MPKARGAREKRTATRPKRSVQGRVQPPFEASVRDLASDGRGVLQAPDGRAVFVPGVWPGERVRVVVTGRQGKVVQGELLEVLVPAAGRRDAPCPHHGTGDHACGGCPWQFVDYPTQLQGKRARLQSQLRALGCESIPVEMLAAPDEWVYRNRAQFKTDGKRLGYVAQGSRQLVDVSRCAVLTPGCQAKMDDLRSRLPHSAWRPRRGRDWTTLDVDDLREGAMVNQRQTFRQGNSDQNTAMKAWVSERLTDQHKGLPALELFAGAGNFTEVLIEAGLCVTAAEVQTDGLLDRARSDWPSLQVATCNLYDNRAAGELARQKSDTEFLFLDPPRDGFLSRESMLPQFKALAEVIYVSCNPATWQRDSAYLQTLGLELVEVALIDLFPQTPHIELLSRFRRAGT